MGAYENHVEHTVKTNGKTVVEAKIESFYNNRPFLAEKQLFDIIAKKMDR